jgi:hypothetical protein
MSEQRVSPPTAAELIDERRRADADDRPTAVEDIATALAELRKQSDGGAYVTASAAETKQRLGHAHSLELHRAQRLGLAGWLGVWCLLISGAIAARYVSEELAERDSMISADKARIKELRSELSDVRADADEVRSDLVVELSGVRRDLAESQARADRLATDARAQSRLAEILRSDREASAQKTVQARIRADKALADLRAAEQRRDLLEGRLRDLAAPTPTATTRPAKQPTGETEEPDVPSP